MATRDIIVVGASAGGVDALTRMIGQLPADFPAAVLLTVHIPPIGESLLPVVLRRAGALRAMHARDGERIEQGKMLIAPPDRHMIVEDRHVHLTRGPKENYARPAIDPMFRSAAAAYGARVVGIMLSGALDDGVAGLWEIKRRGGISIVQTPEDARHPNMPRNAMAHVPVDHIGTAAEIGVLLRGLTLENVPETPVEIHRMAGIPTSISCPECRGSLELFSNGGGILEYRCRVKHAYSPEAMLAAHSETEERTLWSAVVALEEGAELAENLAPNLPDDTKNSAQETVKRNREAARGIRRVIEGFNTKQVAGSLPEPTGT